ncbi:MAG: TIGR04255 family protein [Pseudomonadales bacterium]
MTRYRNAPLVEVIVELHWNSGSDSPFAGAPTGIPAQFPIFDSSSFEKLLSRFNEKLGQNGGVHSERLIPSGFPLMGGQVAHRLRRSPNAAELYQLGPGVFTANAVPPYDSWSAFTPFLEEGISMLLSSRPENEQQTPFSNISLQYIDAFNESVVRGASPSEFIKNDLGFVLSTPDALEELKEPGHPIKYNFQLNTPIRDGLLLSLSVGEGSANGSSAVVVHTNIQAASPIAPDINSILATLKLAQKVQNKIFQSMIVNIADRLEPIDD